MFKPTIILVNPQMGENIGAAARAMKNFNLDTLHLVNPRDGWPNPQAEAMASGALDYIDVQIFETFAESIADLRFTFATTSRRRDMVKPVYTPESATQESIARSSRDQKIGIVFGAERTGLENDDLALCSAIISIPVNPDFPSLNLAQSVLLMAYEWMRLQDGSASQTLNMNDSFPAEQKDVYSFLERLESDLDDRNFFRSEDLRETVIKNIQNIFTRADISDQELRTLHGVLSALRGNKSSDKS